VGWDVGGEEIGDDGIASWKWAVPAAQTVTDSGDGCAHRPRPPIVLHVIRNPVDCVPSVAYLAMVEVTEPQRRKSVFIPGHSDPIIRAIWSYLGWNLLCKAQCTQAAKTEHLEDVVRQITGIEVKRSPGHFNSRDHPTLTEHNILNRIGDDSMTLQAWHNAKDLWDEAQ
jgi:hypothetical protein